MKESTDKFFRSASLKLFFVQQILSQRISPRILFISEPDADTAFELKELKLPSTFNPPMSSTFEHIYEILIE